MKKLIALITLMFVVGNIFAGDIVVNGSVCDMTKGDAIIGAMIKVKNTNIAAISDINGKFSVRVPDSAKTLEVLYIGYNTKEVAVEPRLTVYLEAFPETQSISANNLSQVQAVDLGLSVKWASCNVGALSPDDSGDYYSWGETKTKSNYTKSNSITTGKTIENLPHNMDIANMSLGLGWRLPSYSEVEELVNNCRWSIDYYNGVKVMKAQGPNGNSIYFPYSGIKLDKKLEDSDNVSVYWTSHSFNDDNNI